MKIFTRIIKLLLSIALIITIGLSQSAYSAGKLSSAIIGHLLDKDKLITIVSGNGGPVYTVKEVGGEILATGIPASILFARFPELKNVIEHGFAGNDASLGPKPEIYQKNSMDGIANPGLRIDHSFLLD